MQPNDNNDRRESAKAPSYIFKARPDEGAPAPAVATAQRAVKPKRKKLIIICCAIFALAVVLIALGLADLKRRREEIIPTQAVPDVKIEDDPLAWTRPEPVTPEQFPYDASEFTLKNGVMQFSGAEKTYKGLDVSEHQENVDWSLVKADGFDFAMIRVGLRRGTVGLIAADSDYEKNIKGAYDAGLKVGVYFFSQAINIAEAQEEAATVLEWLKPYREMIDYPVAFDWEYQYFSDEKSRSEDVTADVINDCTVAFCEIIKNNGYTPMVYLNLNFYRNVYDMQTIANYDLWLSEEFDGTILFPYEAAIWQYNLNGELEHIDNELDFNISFRDYSNE